MHWSRNINIIRYDLLADELQLVEGRIKFIRKKIKDVEYIVQSNILNIALVNSLIDNNVKKSQKITLLYFDQSALLNNITIEQLTDSNKRNELHKTKEIEFFFPGKYISDEIQKLYDECTKMNELLMAEYGSLLNVYEQIRSTLQNELEYYKQKIVNPDYPDEMIIDEKFYERLFSKSSVSSEPELMKVEAVLVEKKGKKINEGKDKKVENEKNQDGFDAFEYDNLEDAPQEFIDKILYGDHSELKKASGGIIGDLCEKYAPKYKLEKGKPLKKKYEFIIAAEIIRNDKYYTTHGSVGSTMRSDKLKYRKPK